MSPLQAGPRAIRLRRLYHHGPHGLLVTPLDHTLACGPVTRLGWTLDDLVAALAAGGSDAIVLHKGAVRQVAPEHLADVSLIVHLNGSTASAPDPDAKVMLTSVEEAIRVGADAVSLHVNLGAASETQQIQGLATVAEACDRWNLPLLAMVYPRGPAVEDPLDPDLLLRAVTIAADLGADLVKTAAPRQVETVRDLAQRCPVPLLLAGGAPRTEERELVADVRRALAGGVGGLAMGRTLFHADDPRHTTATVADLIHQKPELLISPKITQKGTDHVDDDHAYEQEHERECDEAVLA
ncbi:MAG: 2-amino-3,7-dideoxy-D-threo-hept-6-ulosonate synthase [Ornithinimicrobium sp.]